MDKREFVTIEEGTRYALPIWTVIDGKGIEKTGDEFEIQFVRGSKKAEEEIPKADGILHETLLSMMITDLKYKQGLVPSREGALAITKLEEALLWMEERQKVREKAGTVGTYQK